MLALHEVETFLSHAPPYLLEIVLELRNIIASVAPDAVEDIRWRGLNYYHEDRGGIVSAGICQITVHGDHVRLAFIHGTFLHEPRNLFEGTQKYKRFIRLSSYNDSPWEYLKELIVSASRFDPRAIRL
jgi:hypothetical protein